MPHGKENLAPRTVVIAQGGTVTFDLSGPGRAIHQVAIFPNGTDPADVDTSMLNPTSPGPDHLASRYRIRFWMSVLIEWYGCVRLPGVEERLPHVLHVVVADGVGEDGQQVVDADARRLHQLRVVEDGCIVPGVDQAPAVAEAVGVVAVDVEALRGVVLEEETALLRPSTSSSTALRAELRGVEAVEEDRPSAALGVADFAGEDGLPR